MLLAISFTFVLALFPTVFVSLLMHILVYTNPAMAQTVFYNLTNVKDLLELISEINYAVNFYIYVMSGAQFRYELRNVLMRRYTFISNGGDRVVQFRKSYSSWQLKTFKGPAAANMSQVGHRNTKMDKAARNAQFV